MLLSFVEYGKDFWVEKKNKMGLHLAILFLL